ncbi:uncharacterized protein PV06_00333 [Exophiala oligosperma]|uniref:Heterokaryon incompatibility domain-containing protein n=1 Tax=Exophiala oligosperma TaxID=215243 RepID=A0A0D2DYJ1_9EURO|nr:uncharacterized protein PV06_00333 [Exophiala oligosperma]KIW47660.1 hypothetical protein PV06_00333 [Exophiala oligosperma]
MHLLRLDSDGQPRLTLCSELQAPKYAVLSHTWEEPSGEVTFKDMSEHSGNSKPGYRKIEFCGTQARTDGLEYFWVDTCCIDRGSSEEVSKAINSMFQWYRNAEKCYVYLADVSTSSGADREVWEEAFRKSRWFYRGWTLQELLAPQVVEFFSREGQKLGDKESLLNLLHEVTEIPSLALQGLGLKRYSVEQRFQWAAKRHTMEPEDKAYSLLGIFEVSIPLIYGEGEKHAWDRLQNAIEEQTERERRGKLTTSSPY